MPEAFQIVQSFVAPVVMISANGLLCLAFYNRLAAVVHRVREINRERFDLETRLAGDGQKADAAGAARIKARIDTLHELGHRLFDRVKLIRDSLVCLLISVLFMLGCSLALGLAALSVVASWFALGGFVLGTVATGAGTAFALWELRVSLDPLLFEHAMLELMPDEKEDLAE